MIILDIIALLAIGDTSSIKELADQLSLPQSSLIMLLEEMEEKGLVSRFGGSCATVESSGCLGCASKSSCQSKPGLQGYQITNKARRMIERIKE